MTHDKKPGEAGLVLVESHLNAALNSVDEAFAEIGLPKSSQLDAIGS